MSSKTNPKVMISIPTNENIHAETVGWLLVSMANAAKIGYVMGVHIMYSPYPLECQRNAQAIDFLDCKDYTHLFLLDSDCVPENGTVERLLSHDKDIVAAVAPALLGGNHVFTAATKIQEATDIAKQYRMLGVKSKKAHGLKKVDAVGATGVLIKRHVMEALTYPYFEVLYTDDNRIELGEDFYFCKKATEAGFDIWADFDCRQKHYKLVVL